jgi:hypothetical protein
VSEETPRLDGLYVAPGPGNESSGYLRFSPGNKVSKVSSIGNAAQVFKWLTPEHANSSQGTYTFNNGRIRFTVTSERGVTTTFEGTVANDGLRLVIFSPGPEAYSFTQLDVPSAESSAPASFNERRSSKSRFSATGKVSGYLSAGPHVTDIDGEFWPVINVSVSDGTHTASIDFPIDLAQAMIMEMQRIIAEYGDGNEVPRNWATPFS